ncbi:MAG: hypothetical protein K8T26_01625 [Lentisphaerae bacterium]|nr:hypothetical protein [Lentisphaerota bacterium]
MSMTISDICCASQKPTDRLDSSTSELYGVVMNNKQSGQSKKATACSESPASPVVQKLLNQAVEHLLNGRPDQEVAVLNEVASICTHPDGLRQYIPVTLPAASLEGGYLVGETSPERAPNKISDKATAQAVLAALCDNDMPLVKQHLDQLSGSGKTPFLGGMKAYFNGAYGDALELLLESESPEAILTAATCALLERQWNRGYTLLLKVVENDSAPAKHRAAACLMLCSPYLRFRVYGEAERLLGQGVSCDPDNYECHLLLMKILLQQNREADAQKHYLECKRIRLGGDAEREYAAFIQGNPSLRLPLPYAVSSGIKGHSTKNLKVAAPIEEILSKSTETDKGHAVGQHQKEQGQLSVPLTDANLMAYLSPEVARDVVESGCFQSVVSVPKTKGAAIIMVDAGLTPNEGVMAYALHIHQAKEVNPIQLACLYRYLNESAGMTTRELEKRLGNVSRSQISNYLAWFALPDSLQKFIAGKGKGRNDKLQYRWVDITHSYWPMLRKVNAAAGEKKAMEFAGNIISDHWPVSKLDLQLGDIKEEQRRDAKKQAYTEGREVVDTKGFTFKDDGGFTHRFLKADSSRIDSSVIPDASVDLVLTSPPYLLRGMGYEMATNIDEWWNIIRPVLGTCIRVLKDGAMAVINLADADYRNAIVDGKKNTAIEEYMTMVPVFSYMREQGMHLHARIIWHTSPSLARRRSAMRNAAGSHASYRVIGNWEYLWVFRKGKSLRPPRSPREERLNKLNTDDRRKLLQGLWFDERYSNIRLPDALKLGGKHHECPFPPLLVEDLIRTWSYKGDTVFDPFGGMGTVAYSAIQLHKQGRGGRNTIISELDGYHLEMAKKWARAMGFKVPKA